MADIGRPTVVTPEILNKLEQAFLMGCSDLEACFIAGIGKTALYDYQKANPDFTERKEEMKQKPIILARTSVINAMKNDGDLALKFLERKRKDEFGVKQTFDHTFNTPVVINETIRDD